MFSKILGLSFLTLAAAQSLPINITAPSSNIWFVSDSLNTISWTPCQGQIAITHPELNMVVNNKDQTILPGNLTVLGAVPTTDCEKSFTPTNLPVGSGYTMILFDSTSNQIVGVSSLFEVMAQGSAYASVTTSSDSGPTATGTNGSATPQESGSSNGTSPAAKNGAASSFSFSITQKTVVALAGVAGVAVTLF